MAQYFRDVTGLTTCCNMSSNRKKRLQELEFSREWLHKLRIMKLGSIRFYEKITRNADSAFAGHDYLILSKERGNGLEINGENRSWTVKTAE